jgi:hypothetical protein
MFPSNLFPFGVFSEHLFPRAPRVVSVAVSGIAIIDDLGAAAVVVGGLPTLPTQLRQAVYSRLSGTAAITNLVGTRIYFGALPQSIKLDDGPALSYMVSTRTYGHTLGGGDGTSQGRVQIVAYAYIEQTVDLIAQTLRDSWDGFRGFINDFEVTACVLDNESDLSSPPSASTDQWTFTIASDYQINHRS